MSLADTAADLLDRFGETLTVTYQPSTPAYDPITGEPQTPSASNTATSKGYAGNYNSSDIDGDLIKANDVRLILQVLDDRPVKGAHVTVDSVKYRIMNTQFIRQSGADVIYICQLRAN